MEYVIRMENGFYYNGMEGGRVIVSAEALAKRFPGRWQALQACAQGPEFAGAAIMPVGENETSYRAGQVDG